MNLIFGKTTKKYLQNCKSIYKQTMGNFGIKLANGKIQSLNCIVRFFDVQMTKYFSDIIDLKLGVSHE